MKVAVSLEGRNEQSAPVRVLILTSSIVCRSQREPESARKRREKGRKEAHLPEGVDGRDGTEDACISARSEEIRSVSEGRWGCMRITHRPMVVFGG